MPLLAADPTHPPIAQNYPLLGICPWISHRQTCYTILAMAKQSQATVSIPVSLVLQVEAWGRLTARLFQELRCQAGLKPRAVPDDQAWYWAEQWQRWERQADQDIAAGRVREFRSVDGLFADLDA